MPAPKKHAFKLAHPYGGRLPGFALGEAVIVHASTMPELVDKLSMLFEFSYEAVSPRTKESF